MGRGDLEECIPIDERPQGEVRALIFARTSDPGGSEGDVESQVHQCDKFLRDMGWHHLHPDNLYKYTETKSGMRQVRRPVLEQVLRMAAQNEVDVIVSLKLSRIDRRMDMRQFWLHRADRFGVEFRFVNHPETRGKLPEGELAAMAQFIEDMYDQREAKEIVARMTPEKMRGYELGLPHGGRNGPLYGYSEGEHKVRESRSHRPGKQMGLLTWVVDEDRAKHVRWLLQTVDERPLPDLSLRGLTREMEVVRGAPTATGRTIGVPSR